MDLDTAKVLTVITARGGSKGLPRKNILPLAGKPLIGWTIAASRAAQCVARTVVSTECDEIARVAREEGAEVPFMRPAELATDTAGSIGVLRHAVECCKGYEYVLLLQPTSPLRTAEDIDAAFLLMLQRGVDSCVSICEVEESPWLMYLRDGGGIISPLLAGTDNYMRRQEMPTTYRLNGAVYLARTEWFLQEGKLISSETAGYVMPPERSIDIDTREDFERAEQLLGRRLSR